MYKYFFKRLVDIIVGLLAFPLVLLFICAFGPVIYFSDKGDYGTSRYVVIIKSLSNYGRIG